MVFGIRRPPLPRECKCGATETKTCPLFGLENHRNFPPFRDLPDENDVDPDYYERRAGSWEVYKHRRLWMIAGEIIDVSFFVRPRATIRTKYMEEVLVNFHLEDSPYPEFFTFQALKPGNSMVIMLPNRRRFLDTNVGIRQESSRTVMVFEASLDELTAEVDTYRQCSRPPLSSANFFCEPPTKRCFQCKVAEQRKDTATKTSSTLRKTAVRTGGSNTNSEALKVCAKCKVAMYCSKDCQVKHWKARHRHLCRYSYKLQKLAHVDFEHDGHKYWEWTFGANVRPRRPFAEHFLDRDPLDEMFRSFLQMSMLSSMIREFSYDDDDDDYDYE